MENLTITLLENHYATDLEPDHDVDYWAEYLSIETPDCEEAMQAAAEQGGTHADSIELVAWEPGRFALYRFIYKGERDHAEGRPNETAEAAVLPFNLGYGTHFQGRLCGVFLLLTPGE